MLAAPGVVVSLLPKFACPVCAAASLGVLSSLGLGYLLSARYLLPLTAALLALALAALAFKARTRHGYGPFLVGVSAAAGVLLSKFVWESNPTMYAALGLLMVSSVWNAWPRRSARVLAACPACEQDETLMKGE
jgi:hypothetical protein